MSKLDVFAMITIAFRTKAAAWKLFVTLTKSVIRCSEVEYHNGHLNFLLRHVLLQLNFSGCILLWEILILTKLSESVEKVKSPNTRRTS